MAAIQSVMRRRRSRSQRPMRDEPCSIACVPYIRSTVPRWNRDPEPPEAPKCPAGRLRRRPGGGRARRRRPRSADVGAEGSSAVAHPRAASSRDRSVAAPRGPGPALTPSAARSRAARSSKPSAPRAGRSLVDRCGRVLRARPSAAAGARRSPAAGDRLELRPVAASELRPVRRKNGTSAPMRAASSESADGSSGCSSCPFASRRASPRRSCHQRARRRPGSASRSGSASRAARREPVECPAHDRVRREPVDGRLGRRLDADPVAEVDALEDRRRARACRRPGPARRRAPG